MLSNRSPVLATSSKEHNQANPFKVTNNKQHPTKTRARRYLFFCTILVLVGLVILYGVVFTDEADKILHRYNPKLSHSNIKPTILVNKPSLDPNLDDILDESFDLSASIADEGFEVREELVSGLSAYIQQLKTSAAASANHNDSNRGKQLEKTLLLIRNNYNKLAEFNDLQQFLEYINNELPVIDAAAVASLNNAKVELAIESNQQKHEELHQKIASAEESQSKQVNLIKTLQKQLETLRGEVNQLSEDKENYENGMKLTIQQLTKQLDEKKTQAAAPKDALTKLEFPQPPPKPESPLITSIKNKLAKAKQLTASATSSTGVSLAAPVSGADKYASLANMTVIYDIGAGGCAGWAVESINMIMGIHKFVDLAIISGGDYCAGLDPAIVAVLDRLRKREIDSWDHIDVFISHKPPQRYPKWPYEGLRNIEQRPRYIIGRSMTETNVIPKLWVQNSARLVDEIWLPSAHSFKAFVDSGAAPAKLHIIGEPIDLQLYNLEQTRPIALKTAQEFNFFSVFKLEPRKGWELLIQAFLEEFSQNEPVNLHLHTYLFNSPDPRNKKAIVQRIKQFVRENLNFTGRNAENSPLPWKKIHLYTEETSMEVMPQYYKAMDAFVLPSKGEGWGLPLMEAMAMGLATIATNYSGQLEFMNPQNSLLIPISRMEQAEGGDFSEGQFWAIADVQELRRMMRMLVNDYKLGKTLGEKARNYIAQHFTIEKIAHKMLDRLLDIQQILGPTHSEQASKKKRIAASESKKEKIVAAAAEDEEEEGWVEEDEM
jgi:glycosyltransferase involved in cell wall biosynthesis